MKPFKIYKFVCNMNRQDWNILARVYKVKPKYRHYATSPANASTCMYVYFMISGSQLGENDTVWVDFDEYTNDLPNSKISTDEIVNAIGSDIYQLLNGSAHSMVSSEYYRGQEL